MKEFFNLHKTAHKHFYNMYESKYCTLRGDSGSELIIVIFQR